MTPSNNEGDQSPQEIRYLLAGDTNLVVEFGNVIDEQINRRVISVFLTLEAERIPGVVELIPTFRSIYINYDPLKTTLPEVRAWVEDTVKRSELRGMPPTETVEIPTVYGGEYGPDLEFVAQYHGMTPEEVVSLHESGEYRVYMLGFMSGFPYLGGLPKEIATPRLKTPRTLVPAGSVGIAAEQTGIYPEASPGGWQIIGRTFKRLFDPHRSPPSLLSPGDKVRFVRVTKEEFLRGSEEVGREAEATPEESAIEPEEAAWTPILRVIKPGLFTTIQDSGRRFYQKFGVAASGFLDRYSARLANLLVGNDGGEACLEATMLGPEIEFLQRAAFAVTGGDLSPLLNGDPIRMWRSHTALKGDVLSFGNMRSGARAYIAVAGGIRVPRVLGSRSTHVRSRMGGLEGRVLKEGDVLKAGAPRYPPESIEGVEIPPTLIPRFSRDVTVRVIMGPQDDYFTEDGIQTFLSSRYEVAVESDRMGYRLRGPPVESISGSDIVSDAIPLGAVQIPGDGQPIVMMADRQTTGGYAKIATVIDVDVDKIAQMTPGGRVSFIQSTLEDAHRLRFQQEGAIMDLTERLASERLLSLMQKY
ncbi:MAG: 5-oxoprolinase subunit PxpB [Candidatus Geothermarchaeales archaeon]